MRLKLNKVQGGYWYPRVTKGTQTRDFTTVNTIELTVEFPEPCEFNIGDWCEVFGEVYQLNRLDDVKKTSERRYEYSLTMEGIVYDLGKIQYMLYDITNIAVETEFNLMGDLQKFIELMIINLNRNYGFNLWAVGGTIDATEFKNLSFSGENCLVVLQKVMDEYKKEFDIQVENGIRKIYIRPKGTVRNLTFEYGKGKGLYELSRNTVTDKNIFTRIYAYGSTENLGPNYRNFSKRLKLPAVDDSHYQEAGPVNTYGIIESTITYDDIKPERTGTVESIPAGSVLKFADTKMFDLNAKDVNGNTLYLIAGTNAKIHFQTGGLAGYEFEISEYDISDCTFTINPFTDERGMTFPNSTSVAFQIQPGDTYVLLDIMMPQSYIDDAEARLLTRTQEYYSKNCQPRVAYDCKIDPIFSKSTSLVLNPGDTVTIKDVGIGVNKAIRIQDVKRDLLHDYKIEIMVSDVQTVSVIQRLYDAAKEAQKIINNNNLNNPAKSLKFKQGSKTFAAFKGDYDPLVIYKGTRYYTDIVKFNAKYYYTRPDAGTFQNLNPDNDTRWLVFDGYYESLATDLFFAQLAYIENLGVRFLKTSDSGQRIEIDGDENTLAFYDDNDNLVLLLDSDIGIQNTNGNPVSGLKLIDPVTGKVTYVTPNGVFNNNGDMAFLPGSTGIPSNGNIVGLLNKKNQSILGNGMSAAIVGIDQTDGNTPGNSKSYAGLFIGDLFCTGNIYGNILPFNEDLSLQVPDVNNYYLPSDKRLFIGNLKTANRRWYLPAAASFQRWEAISVLCYNIRGVDLFTSGTDKINGVLNKHIWLETAHNTVELISDGSGMWIIKNLNGQFLDN